MKILPLLCTLLIVACGENREEIVERKAEACILMAIEHGREWRNANHPECHGLIVEDYENGKKKLFSEMCRSFANTVKGPFSCESNDKGVKTCFTTDSKHFRPEMFHEKINWQSCQK